MSRLPCSAWPVLDSLAEAIFVSDHDGLLLHATPTARRLLRTFSRTTARQGRRVAELLPASWQDAWARLLTTEMEKFPQRLTLSHVARKTTRHFELSVSLIPAGIPPAGISLLLRDVSREHKEITTLRAEKTRLSQQIIEEEAVHHEANVVLAREIAERKLAEENLKESRERLYQILRGTSIPTFVIDRNHVITHWNRALESLTGFKGSDMVGTTYQWKSFYLKKRPTLADLVVDLASPERIRSYYGGKYRTSTLIEEAYEAEDFFDFGETGKWLFFTAAPLRNTSGEIIGAIETLQDITARKRMEKEIREAHDILEKRIEERTIQLKETYDQLLHAEKLSAVGKLAASIAHEFGNPIIGIRNFLKGLQKSQQISPEDQGVLALAVQECQRVKDLISSLQDFNRPTSGTVAPMDLHKAIDDMLVFCKKSLKEKHIKVERHFDPSLPVIHAVSDQIKQVILNCLNNAAEAITSAKGTIRITTEHRANMVLLHIADTGRGISPEHMDFIFEPFYSTKPAVEGTGLGLSVSYGIIKKHRGTIEVTETSRKGTTFTISLPVNSSQGTRA